MRPSVTKNREGCTFVLAAARKKTRTLFTGLTHPACRSAARCVAVYSALSAGLAMLGQLHPEILSGWHGALAPAALMPLMLPHVAASVRSSSTGDGEERRTPRGVQTESPATGALRRLTRINAALVNELRELKSAYLRLEIEIAERRAAAQRLEHLAHHDTLTDLPNRVRLMDRLNQALASAQRAGTHVLVIYLDLDRFKEVNDTLGHAAGDRVLAEIGSRLRTCLRGADTASRIGGDEFVLVCATADAPSEAPRLAARVLSAIALPIDIDGTPITLGASLGVSRYPADGLDAPLLIRLADVAMYGAKARGRNGFNVYGPQSEAGLESTGTLEADLRAALERREFEVRYQPVADVRSGRITAAQALVCWRHPTRGLLAASEFMASAHQLGLASEIGAGVVRSVCAQLKRFALRPTDAFAISIDVTRDEFSGVNFVQCLAEALAQNAIDGRRLQLTLSERTACGSVTALATLRNVQRLGVTIAIGDFGTGSSSFANLKTLPVQSLNIHRSLTADIVADAGDVAIARTVVTLAHSLGMNVTADGIETEAQAEILDAIGVDAIAGSLISVPLEPTEFERFACTYGSLTLAA